MRLLLRETRRRIALVRRSVSDLITGQRSRILCAKNRAADYESDSFSSSISIRQAVGHSQHTDAKINNISMASKNINGVLFPPGTIFSFWSLIGPPTLKCGFLPGRTIQAGRIELDSGGGLCQLSGIIYYLALKAGIEVLERHSHSTDIYAEDERFTPLGSDATVVYGFKDLRLKNRTSQVFMFDIAISDGQLTGVLKSNKPIKEHVIEFKRAVDEWHRRVVETYSTSPSSPMSDLIATSIYRIG